jgi:hypothetical protein
MRTKKKKSGAHIIGAERQRFVLFERAQHDLPSATRQCEVNKETRGIGKQTDSKTVPVGGLP